MVKNKWEKVSIAYGIAVYEHDLDNSIADTARRADKLMYDNKRKMKKA
jgi:PleD family two-component response regulator